MKTYLNTKYGYNPGRYTGYSIDTPAFRLLSRLDWNINESNKLSFRFSKKLAQKIQIVQVALFLRLQRTLFIQEIQIKELARDMVVVLIIQCILKVPDIIKNETLLQ